MITIRRAGLPRNRVAALVMLICW